MEKETHAMVKSSGRLVNWFRPGKLRWLILVALSLIISIFLFPHFLSKPKIYRLGDVADIDIKASKDLLIENKELTEKNRDKAVKEVFSIYDFDRSGSNLVTRIKEVFREGKKYSSKLSHTENPTEMPSLSGEKISQDNSEDDDHIRNQFFPILDILPDEKLLDPLMKTGFPAGVEKILTGLMTTVLNKGVVGNRMMLMSQIEKGKIVLHDISTRKEITVRDFSRFYDLDGAGIFLENQRGSIMEILNSPELSDISIKLAQSLIKPNLTYNQRETELRKDLARKSVKPVYFKIKKGEMLVREGERIGPDHLLKLSGETTPQDRIDMLGQITAMAVLLGLLFLIMYLIGLKSSKS
ncbi:MAG: hypothetical protein QGG48_08955, partial [Desulfatiglandales bacterium]|nr:hypothetical protein [Desulfatiglandales bacterium]